MKPRLALAAAGLAILAAGALNAAADGPILQLQPAQVASGSSVTVSGSGFCGAAGCSPVTLKVDDRVIATDIVPSADGNFQRQFTVVESPGVHEVKATQTAANGSPISTSVRMAVGAADPRTPPSNSPPATRPPGTPPPATPVATPPGNSPPASATPSPAASATPGSTPTSGGPSNRAASGSGGSAVPGFWLAIAVAVLLAAVGTAAWWLWRRRRDGVSTDP